MKLPLELIENIYSFISFDKIILLSDYVANDVYKKRIKNISIDLLKKYSFSYKTLDFFYEKQLTNLSNLIYIIDTGDTDLCSYVHCKYYHKNKVSFSCSLELYYTIAISKNLKMVKWFNHNCKDSFSKDTMEICCRYGHIDMLEYLHNNRNDGCYITRCVYSCMENDMLDHKTKEKVIMWLYENKKELFTDDIIVELCTRSQEVLYILYKYIPNDVLKNIKYIAILYNNLSILNFFKEKEFIKG